MLEASPKYWIDRIAQDLIARKEYELEVRHANELLTNELDLQVRDQWVFKRSTWMKTFQHIGGLLFYSDAKAKVEGVGDEDVLTAGMYEALINWEFTHPRGLQNKIGRREVRRVGEDMISYGLGGMLTYFSPYHRSVECPTGSIINEAIFGDELILDSSARHFFDINHIARMYKKSKAEIERMFPFLDPLKIPHKDGLTCLYDIEFRTPCSISGKMTTPEMREITGDDAFVWSAADRDRVEALYRKGKKGAKVSDSKKAWDSLKDDHYVQPMVYSFQFLTEGDRNKMDLPIYNEARYIGTDFSYTLMPFVFQPKRVYPAGAAKFIYDDQVYEATLMTLYMKMLKHLNNTGIAVNIDNVMGEDDLTKMEHVKKFMTESGYPLMIKHAMDVNSILSQLKQNPPPRDMLMAAERAAESGSDFFQTHSAQVGQTPPAGTPFRSMALAQSQAGTLMKHMVDSVGTFYESVYKKIAKLAYKYIPNDKKIRYVNLSGEKKVVLIEVEKLRERDPQEFDITVSIDTDTETQKLQKKQEAFELFDRGVSAPEDFLTDLGVRNVQERLGRIEDYKRGQVLRAMEKISPEFEAANNEAIRVGIEQAKESR